MDLNKYRSRTDTEHEWQMKKLFLERYHDQFGEDRLLCMAQCYVNIETLGCRYPNQLMQEIKRLTSDFEPVIKGKNQIHHTLCLPAYFLPFQVFYFSLYERERTKYLSI